MSYPPTGPGYQPGPPPEEPYHDGSPTYAGWSQPTEPAPKKTRWGLIIGTVVALLLCFVGSFVACTAYVADNATKPKPAAVPDESVQPSVTPPKGKPSPAAKKPAAPTKIRAGEWLVGDDVRAGTYTSPGAAPGMIMACIWTVKASEAEGANVLDFGTSTKADEQGRVKLKDGNVFETSGCKDWVRK